MMLPMFRRGPILLAAALFLTLGAERAGLQADVPERSDRVVSYTIAAELIPEHQTVHGKMDLVWRNTTEVPVGELYFHLYLNAFKDMESSHLRESGGEGKRRSRWSKEYPGWIRINSMLREDGSDLWTDATRHFVAPDDGNEKDRTLARVDLPAPVAPGETIALKVDFDSRLPRVFRRTGWAGDPADSSNLFFMAAQWFPKIAVLRRTEDGKASWNAHQFHRNTEFFSDFGVYQVSITVPAGYRVGATGNRISESESADGATRTYVHRQEDVHDFAWTASPFFSVKEFRWSFDEFCAQAPNGMGGRVTELLERTAAHLGLPVEKVRPDKEVLVRIMLQQDHAGVADRFRWAAGAALACYGIWFGAYTYDVLTVVDPPAGGGAAGGMEYPTLITVWGDRTAPDYATGMEGVTVHEFGHQYFYGLVASNEFEEAWLDEGLTTYTTARIFEETYPPRSTRTEYGPIHTPYHRPFAAKGVYEGLHALLSLESWMGKIPHPWEKPDEFAPVPQENGLWTYLRDMPFIHLGEKSIPPAGGSRSRFLESDTQDAMVMKSWDFATRGDYGTNSYRKPTLFLYCLRGLMGEKAFDRALYAYATKHRFGHPGTGDLLGALRNEAGPRREGEDASEPPAGSGEAASSYDAGAQIDGFIEAMVETAARLDVAVLSAEEREIEEGRWEWTIRVQRRGQIPVPVELRIDDELLATWHSRGRETTRTFRFLRDRPLGTVRLGPDWLRHIDSDLSNNARLPPGERDRRAAIVLAVRWSLFAEDIVRTYAGLAR
jgi:hypothetical protein